MVLCRRISLLGCFSPPFYCFNFILWNIYAIVIYEAEVKLIESISLLSGLIEPLNCFCIVPRHTLAASLISHTEVKLCSSISLFRSFTKPASCFGVVLLYALTIVVKHTDVVLRIGIARHRLRQQRRINAFWLSLSLGRERRRYQESRDGCNQCRCKDKRTDELLTVYFHSASRNRNENSTVSPFLPLLDKDIFIPNQYHVFAENYLPKAHNHPMNNLQTRVSFLISVLWTRDPHPHPPPIPPGGINIFTYPC